MLLIACLSWYAAILYFKHRDGDSMSYKKINLYSVEITMMEIHIGKNHYRCFIHREKDKISWSRCNEVIEGDM
jgi:hypothetical protein